MIDPCGFPPLLAGRWKVAGLQELPGFNLQSLCDPLNRGQLKPGTVLDLNGLEVTVCDADFFRRLLLSKAHS